MKLKISNFMKEAMHPRSMATYCLMLSMFFLPAGYDVLFALIMKWTGSYWTADFIFYCLSGFLFICYILFSKKSKRIDSIS